MMEGQFHSLIDIFKTGKEQYPEKTAIIMGEDTRTYGQIFDNAKRIAGFVLEKEIKPQDKVAVISQNHVDYIETVLGIIMAGGVPVNINWRLAAPELHHLLQFNEVKLTFFRSKDESIRKEMGELTKEMCQCVDMDCIKEVLEGVEPLEQFIEREDEDVLMHLHTSGTTGMPKTVRYTKGQYMRELTTCVHSLGFDKDTVFQLMSQLFHSASIGPYSIFACGGTIVLFPKFSPQEYLKSIEKHHVTRLSAIPTVLTALLNQPDFDRYDLSSIHTISYSTCPMPPELIKRALKHFNCGFQQSYGMTEMGSIVTMLTEEEHIKDNMRYLNSVGRPIEDHKVKIIADDGSECAPGETGEIVVTGPGMMKDYYKMPDETKEVMVDGWYHTRDMGYLDENGYLYISGRKSDMIISGGENIFPLEVENVLRMREDIAEVCVLGVPDDYWGESVQAVVVLRPGSKLTPEEIRTFCRGKIAGYKIPKKVYIWEELPKNTTGKICKAEVLKKIEM